jgi:hypothetical protein
MLGITGCLRLPKFQPEVQYLFPFKIKKGITCAVVELQAGRQIKQKLTDLKGLMVFRRSIFVLNFGTLNVLSFILVEVEHTRS